MSGPRRVIAGLLWTALLLAGCGDRRRDAIERDLLTPYAAALRGEDLDAARTRFSTPGRLARVSDITFLAAQASHRERWGPVQALRLQRDAVEPAGDPDCPACVRAFVLWEGERASAELALDIVETDGRWRIDRSWLWPSDGVGVEKVF